MSQFSYKQSPSGSLLVRVKAFTTFTVEVTYKGYWLPTPEELEGKLRPEKDFSSSKGKTIERVNIHMYNRVRALVRYLTEDLSLTINSASINAEKIKTNAGNALYRAWFGSDKEEACYFYLSQFPKRKVYRYRTSTNEINFSSLMTRAQWVELREMILKAKEEYKVIPVTDKDEKTAVMNAFFYSLALKKVKEASVLDYKKNSARKNEDVAKPTVKKSAPKKAVAKK